MSRIEIILALFISEGVLAKDPSPSLRACLLKNYSRIDPDGTNDRHRHWRDMPPDEAQAELTQLASGVDDEIEHLKDQFSQLAHNMKEAQKRNWLFLSNKHGTRTNMISFNTSAKEKFDQMVEFGPLPRLTNPKHIQTAHEIIKALDDPEPFSKWFLEVATEAQALCKTDSRFVEKYLYEGKIPREAMMQVLLGRANKHGLGKFSKYGKEFKLDDEFRKFMKEGKLFFDYTLTDNAHGADSHWIQLLFVVDHLEKTTGDGLQVMEFLKAAGSMKGGEQYFSEIFDLRSVNPTYRSPEQLNAAIEILLKARRRR